MPLHAADITSEAVRCFKTEPAAAPRSATLGCLQTLLELRRPQTPDQSAPAATADSTRSGSAAAAPDGYSAAELVNLARELQNQYVRNKKLTPGIQGDLLQTLGTLLELNGKVGIVSMQCAGCRHMSACTAPALQCTVLSTSLRTLQRLSSCSFRCGAEHADRVLRVGVSLHCVYACRPLRPMAHSTHRGSLLRARLCCGAQSRKSLPERVPLLASPLHCHSYRQAAAVDVRRTLDVRTLCSCSSMLDWSKPV